MPTIIAAVHPPSITLYFTRNGNPAGNVTIQPPPVYYERDAPGYPQDQWAALANWEAGESISVDIGAGSGGGGGSGSGG